MRRIKIPPLYIAFILLSIVLSISFVQPHQASAQSTGVACAVTPDRVDGQGFNVASLGFNVSSLGFNVSSLGFNVSSLGFNVSSLGFNVSSLGFNVASLEDIVEQILTSEITPDWIVDGLPEVITGTGYNSIPTYILIVDDFSGPNTHGVKVRATFDMLMAGIDANDGDPTSGPNIIIQNIDIQPVDYDAALIAGEIKNAVDALPANAHVVVNMSFGLIPCDDDTDVLLVDDENEEGNTFLVTSNFSFDEYEEGPSEERPFESLSPVLECVETVYYGEYEGEEGEYEGEYEDEEGEYGYSKMIAYFGYNNPNGYNVEIPIGSDNKFSPHPKDRGQPTVFAPGRHRFVFSVEYGYETLVWKLGNKTATAGYEASECEGEIPEPPSEIFPEGFGLSNYFNEQMGIPNEFVDEYFEYLFDAAEEPEADPFANIQLLMRQYLQTTYQHATDGNPDTNFALIPVASAGNFRHLFGGDALKPAEYPEVIATSASVGNFGTFWPFSHDGNIIAPGVSIILSTDSTGAVTDLGAGTSYASPYVSALSALWLTYPNACSFGANGTPPLVPAAVPKDANAIFTGVETPLACAFNLPPVINIDFEEVSIDEGATQVVGTVSDPNGDVVTLSTDNANFVATNNLDGTWSISALDGLHPPVTEVVTVTADDGKGGVSTVNISVNAINVNPEAEFAIYPMVVDVGEASTLSLSDIEDASSVDSASPFDFEFYCDAYSEVPDASGQVTIGQVASTDCIYGEPGTYPVMASIADKDGGKTIYDGTIVVESSEPIACYASEVVLYEPGTRKNGRALRRWQTKPHRALGEPMERRFRNFVSLGFAHGESPSGVLIVGFGENSILNNNGSEPDVRIWETTLFDNRIPWWIYPEAVDVFASTDGETWVHIGRTHGHDEAYDLGDLSHANYIKLVDVTKRRRFGRNADGFDVDAIEGFDCGYSGEGEG